jgi:hypothetical protein
MGLRACADGGSWRWVSEAYSFQLQSSGSQTRGSFQKFASVFCIDLFSGKVREIRMSMSTPNISKKRNTKEEGRVYHEKW